MSPLLLVLLTGAAIGGVELLARRRRHRAPMSYTDWLRLARRCGLAVCETPAPRHLQGHRGGILITVSLSEQSHELGFQIHAALPVVLPPDTLVTARSGAAEGIVLRSPILRGLLSARGGEPVRALLDDPVVLGPLLAVFTPWDGATVDTHGVHIRGESDRPHAALPEAIDAAAALADTLAAAWRRQSAQ